MSFSLDDIWAEPVAPEPTPQTRVDGADDDHDSPTRPSPAKRRRTTLFLSSDSEDGSPQAKTQPLLIPPKSTPHTPRRADIEALFDGLDDDDAFQELAPSLDVERLRKEAAARLPPLTPHALLSSSPPRDLGDDADEGSGAGGKKGKKDADGLHKRKLRPKLDEARLLAPEGFPALVKQAKHFRPKGKGHELSDLNNLMQVYQFWSHRMYPNNHFEANVQRVEQLCRTRRMMNSVGIWKDQFHGTVNGLRPEELNNGGESDTESEGEAKTPPPDRNREAASSSPPRPVPSSSRVMIVDDDWDLDAVIREAQERNNNTSSPPPRGSDGGAVSAPGTSQAHSSSTLPPSSPPAATMSEDEDAAMWDEFGIDEAALLAATEEPQTRPPPPAPAPPSSAQMMDEDEDMWDVVREMEQEQMAQANAPANRGGKAGQEPTNDEGWDEMYM